MDTQTCLTRGQGAIGGVSPLEIGEVTISYERPAFAGKCYFSLAMVRPPALLEGQWGACTAVGARWCEQDGEYLRRKCNFLINEEVLQIYTFLVFH
jgi:hypothetical protein